MSEVLKTPESIISKFLDDIPYAEVVIDTFEQTTLPTTYQIIPGRDCIMAKTTFPGYENIKSITAFLRSQPGITLEYVVGEPDEIYENEKGFIGLSKPLLTIQSIIRSTGIWTAFEGNSQQWILKTVFDEHALYLHRYDYIFVTSWLASVLHQAAVNALDRNVQEQPEMWDRNGRPEFKEDKPLANWKQIINNLSFED